MRPHTVCKITVLNTKTRYVIPLGSVIPGQKTKDLLLRSQLLHCSTNSVHTRSCTHTHRAWNVLPSAAVPSHSTFWTGSSELVTWGDGIRPLTHALTSRGEQPSGGQTSASGARLTQHGWQRQTGKPHSQDDYYKRTNITESNSCLHAKQQQQQQKKKKRAGLMMVCWQNKKTAFTDAVGKHI